ncbi:MAG TPA: HemK/PrmC family methyltransferase [Patescibacteria group bacterium]|nr:HemK/PrmC family methyltransferase [Patescibacteria group bacterium]
MNLNQALKKATEKLIAEKIGSASLDAELLLSLATRKPKEFLHAYPEKQLNFLQKLKLNYLIKRRLKGCPLAYLTGQKEFYGHSFYVNKQVLIPRPLTEKIIDLALKEVKKGFSIVDVGTGSGNIIISLALELQKKHPLNDFKLYGLDISRQALKVAKKNARIHKLNKKIAFLRSNLLEKLKDEKIDLILANLPYLEAADLNEPSIQKEPKMALVGNYAELSRQIEKLQSRPVVICEDKEGVSKKEASAI